MRVVVKFEVALDCFDCVYSFSFLFRLSFIHATSWIWLFCSSVLLLEISKMLFDAA